MKNSRKKIPAYFFLLYILFLYTATAFAAEQDKSLKVITSSDPASNKAHSFIYLNKSSIPSGIKKSAKTSQLHLQIPFVIDLPFALQKDESIQWLVETPSKYVGGIKVLSKYPVKKSNFSRRWQSLFLTDLVADRARLVFRPNPEQHRPTIYKKGRGKNGKRRKYGGGTRKVNEKYYNPRLSYTVIAKVRRSSGNIEKYSALIEMDNIDLARQEYINHYGINRYGRGGYGNLPVPTRDEISKIPPMPRYLLGNALSESRYGLMIDDGLTELAVSVALLFENTKQDYRKNKRLFSDLNGKKLPVPDSDLWLSGGWRNPERNEWYSNALNGIHQRGGAIDVVANEPHDDLRSAIVYWFLWKALSEQKLIDAFWQLETNGRPMTTREFEDDVEPKNGIPDAFDKADHMHINIKYE